MNYKFLLFASVLAVALFSCKKDENRVTYKGGKPPVLTASTTDDMVLVDANKDKEAIRFSWTNPDYEFSSGVSSHDVTYTLQVDTVGANFTSPMKQEVAFAKSLGVRYTVKELNAILTKLNLAENMEHQVAFRLKASLGVNALPLFSNIIQINITPYLDVAVPIPPTGELYMTGSAMPSDWTNTPPASQQFTKISNTLYEYVATFEPGKQYKFLSTPGQWQPQYGGSSAEGGELGYNMGGGSDPKEVPTPADPGTYKVTVNFKLGRYTVEKQ